LGHHENIGVGPGRDAGGIFLSGAGGGLGFKDDGVGATGAEQAILAGLASEGASDLPQGMAKTAPQRGTFKGRQMRGRLQAAVTMIGSD